MFPRPLIIVSLLAFELPAVRPCPSQLVAGGAGESPAKPRGSIPVHPATAPALSERGNLLGALSFPANLNLALHCTFSSAAFCKKVRVQLFASHSPSLGLTTACLIIPSFSGGGCYYLSCPPTRQPLSGGAPRCCSCTFSLTSTPDINQPPCPSPGTVLLVWQQAAFPPSRASAGC